MLELSSIELRYIVNHINDKLLDGYYVSQISGITKDSFTIKLHHSVHADIILMISVKGIWISKIGFRQLEENNFVKNMKKELERSRILTLGQLDSERIINIKFADYDGNIRLLICEFFGNGNIILCDEKMNIISILTPLEVRHRLLRVGMMYVPPPSRGLDVFQISYSDIISEVKEENTNLDVARWLGRIFSFPKKFSEEILSRSNIQCKKIRELSEAELRRIFANIQGLIDEVLDDTKHEPVIILDEENNPIIASHRKLSNMKDLNVCSTNSFMDAIDRVLTNEIMNIGKKIFTHEIDKKVVILEHDLIEQDKAKQQVLAKSDSIRKLALELMQISSSSILDLESLLKKYSGKILLEKGKKYLQIMDEQIPLEANIPKVSSQLYARAKELERGGEKIDTLRSKILTEINDLKKRTSIAEKNLKFKRQKSREWFERYRWFLTSGGLLVIGGRDASSNSAIIRKHMTDQDIVFHAEIHGSPFFLIKNLNSTSNSIEQDDQNILETATATISFSRAWREGLSTADAYWVFPDQVKKGAPTGQFLPKGSFVIEGKRNYIKGINLKLAFGVFKEQDSYNMICGPQNSVKIKSIIYVILLPGGIDAMNAAKKLKTELIKNLDKINNEKNDTLIEFLKQTSVDDIIRLLPPGKMKLFSIEKGDKYI